MYEDVSAVLMAGVLGAQVVLTLALLKGEICPGQRGRLHAVFWYLVAGWAFVIPFSPFAALPFITLGFFSLRSKSGKTRVSGPIPVLHLANGFAFLTVFVTAAQLGVITGLLMLIQALLVGSIFAHCLLVKARSRLQAFNKILPVVGVLATMLMAVILAVFTSFLPEDAIAPASLSILISLGLAIVGVFIWTMHLMRHTPPHLVQLSAALFVLIGASTVAMSLVI